MATAREPGPEVANPVGVTVTAPHSERLPAHRQRGETLRPRWPERADALPLGFLVLATAVLVSARYPAWRIVVFASPVVVDHLQRWVSRKHDPRTCANEDPDRLAWWFVSKRLGIFLAVCAAIAVTGAMVSPFLVLVAAPYASALLVVGDRAATRALLAATGLAVCGLAALPQTWSGPELPRSAHTALAVLSVLGFAAALVPFHAAARKVHDDLARARDDMACEALTRARSLEQVGTKVAHELKNPLSAVKALVQLAVRDASEAASQESLQIAEKEIARMQHILDEYLSFSHPLQELRAERIELGSLVADALLVLSARADERRVRLTSQGNAAAQADPRRVKDAVLNLVANAIEATPPGGTVYVEVRSSSEEAEIVVSDSGRGMTPETLRRVGTPFFSTREDGTGLGVVLARSAVAQHGGSLRYESAPGKGTTATVTLPVHPIARYDDATRAAGG